MEWTYKGIIITIDGNGFFNFVCNGVDYSHETLSGAEEHIDRLTKDYYSFSDDDYTNLLKKLSHREMDFVKALVTELGIHHNNAYCSLGITDKFPFEFNFDSTVF